MEYIRVTKENLEKEHICCAISKNSDVQVLSKKAWLADRFDEGLVFLKAAARGKCFIEYIPAENAWVPVRADGYMFINCFWIAGSLKGNGYSNELLEECIRDSRQQGKKGLCVISSAKKKGFLSDLKFLKYKGFQVADTAGPYFELLYLPFEEAADKPEFLPQVKSPEADGKGFKMYYTDQCPLNAKYVPVLRQTAEAKGIPAECVHIQSVEAAKNVPAAVTTFALFYDGQYITHELMSEKKFAALCDKYIEEKI